MTIVLVFASDQPWEPSFDSKVCILLPSVAFLAPAPLRPVLAELGYRGVAEVSVCRSGRRFLAVAYGDDDADGVGGTGANVEQLCLQLAELAAPSRESRRLGLGSNCSKE